MSLPEQSESGKLQEHAPPRAAVNDFSRASPLMCRNEGSEPRNHSNDDD